MRYVISSIRNGKTIGMVTVIRCGSIVWCIVEWQDGTGARMAFCGPAAILFKLDRSRSVVVEFDGTDIVPGPCVSRGVELYPLFTDAAYDKLSELWAIEALPLRRGEMVRDWFNHGYSVLHDQTDFRAHVKRVGLNEPMSINTAFDPGFFSRMIH
jgi:hypothetical protein